MRVLILSDIHANLTALEAVLEDAKDEYDLVWCLGDTVGYGPWPDECVNRVRAVSTTAVIGNHDWAALGRMDVQDFNPEAATRCAVDRGASGRGLPRLARGFAEPTDRDGGVHRNTC